MRLKFDAPPFSRRVRLLRMEWPIDRTGLVLLMQMTHIARWGLLDIGDHRSTLVDDASCEPSLLSSSTTR
jgi:hypothetical protein